MLKFLFQFIVRLSVVEAQVPIGAPFDYAQGDINCFYSLFVWLSVLDAVFNT